MKRRASSILLRAPLMALVFSFEARVAAAAAAPSAHDVDGIDRSARSAYVDGKYAFCTNPEKPLLGRQQALCSITDDLKDDQEVASCEGFRTACNNLTKAKDESSWLEQLAALLGPVARILVYLLMIGIIVIVAIPVIQAIARFRRNKKLTATNAEQVNRALVIENEKPVRPDEVSDAEEALRLAEQHQARGELERALGLYLAASLAALDRRGAIRIARHRTNGEYVRACEEEASRPQLREIVREVDRVEFGGARPTDDGVVRVASRATSIVRRAVTTAATVAMIALFFGGGLGCSPSRRGADPAGDDLPIEVLRRNGFKVGSLGTSLATMPIPTEGQAAPVIIVDVERVPLEDEAHAHMMRWVEAGGVLVLFGNVHGWPKELTPKSERASTRSLVVKTRDPNGGLEDLDASDDDSSSSSSSTDAPDDKTREPFGAPIEVSGARIARSDALVWKGSEAIGFLDKHTYAAKKRIGKGMVLGIANDDLFTNVGILPRHNAAALVTLIRAASHDPLRVLPVTAGATPALGDVRVARSEDGIPPPSNPFAALVAAGLGKGAWHALVAAILLFLAYGIRHARPRAADRKARRAFAEHVEATGAFYGRTRAHTHALGAYGRFMEMRLREIIPRGADPAAFLASRAGVAPDRAAELYARAMQAQAGDEPKGDELNVIEELRAMMEKARSSSPLDLRRQ